MKVLIIIIIAVVLFSILPGECEEYEFINHKVKRGETLWDIVGRYNGKECNRQELIYMTKEKNGIGTIIQPGMTIRVPVRSD